MARHKPVLPKYPVNNDLPPVLPSQAAPGQRVRLPGQSRVTPEEYREFLGLGHGEIFNLDIDL
jgi:15-cis-phytoene desaturase